MFQLRDLDTRKKLKEINLERQKCDSEGFEPNC